jgi:hypothetical protein
MKLLRQLGRAEGTEIVEAAVVLPLLFMFLLGIVWFGRAFNIYSTITQAAEQGAATAARPTCATCGNPADQWNTTDFPGNNTVESSVFSVMRASSLDPAQTIVYFAAPTFCPAPAPPGDCSTTPNNVTICRSVVLNPGGTVPQCGTIVSFQYPFQMNLPFTSLNMQAINLKAQAQSRMEN